MSEATTTKLGTVEKIIKPVSPEMPEKAQIAVHDADHLYREIRIDNTLIDHSGKEVSLKEGATVEVTVTADEDDVKPKTH